MMNSPSYPMTPDEFTELMSPIIKEIFLIRKKYNEVSDQELHELAATLSSDILNKVFGWESKPTVEGKEIKPFRLRNDGQN